jgi:hypothetical protein
MSRVYAISVKHPMSRMVRRIDIITYRVIAEQCTIVDFIASLVEHPMDALPYRTI